MDRSDMFTVSGNGDIIESDDSLAAIGSGGGYSLAAGRALAQHTELDAEQICRRALEIAGDICIYSNRNITVLTFDDADDPERKDEDQAT